MCEGGLLLALGYTVTFSIVMAEAKNEMKKEDRSSEEAAKVSLETGVVELASTPQFSAEAEKRLVRKIDFM